MMTDYSVYYDLGDYLMTQKEWADKTFGEGDRREGILQHLFKELEEIQEDPDDPMEWIDVLILAFDGLLCAGYSPDTIAGMLSQKLWINQNRKWPEPVPGKPTEHIKDGSD